MFDKEDLEAAVKKVKRRYTEYYSSGHVYENTEKILTIFLWLYDRSKDEMTLGARLFLAREIRECNFSLRLESIMGN